MEYILYVIASYCFISVKNTFVSSHDPQFIFDICWMYFNGMHNHWFDLVFHLMVLVLLNFKPYCIYIIVCFIYYPCVCERERENINHQIKCQFLSHNTFAAIQLCYILYNKRYKEPSRRHHHQSKRDSKVTVGKVFRIWFKMNAEMANRGFSLCVYFEWNESGWFWMLKYKPK